MPERYLPGLGLTGFWDEGADGWKPGMDTNLRLLSVAPQLVVAHIGRPLPTAPADGMIAIPAAGPNAHKIAVRDAGAWVYLAPREGWRAWARDRRKAYVFIDNAWHPEDNIPAPADRPLDTRLGSLTIHGAWGLRRLRKDHAGPIVKIASPTRRQGVDIHAGDAGDLDPQALAALGKGRLDVVVLYDQSGHGEDLLADGLPPELKPAGSPAGKPAIDFSGNTRLAAAARGRARPYMVAHPIWFLAARTGTSSGYQFVATIPQSPTGHVSPFYRFGWIQSGSVFETALDGRRSNAPGTLVAGQGYVAAIDASATPAKRRFLPAAGSATADTTTWSGTASWPNDTRLVLGRNGGGGERFDGTIFELVIASGSMTDADRDAWMSDMKKYYTG